MTETITIYKTINLAAKNFHYQIYQLVNRFRRMESRELGLYKHMVSDDISLGEYEILASYSMPHEPEFVHVTVKSKGVGFDLTIALKQGFESSIIRAY